ncbi:MAG: hypothetical protein ABI457_00730 [Hyphomicrobium sp.]
MPFEFFPHRDADPGYLPALVHYSLITSRPVLACPDGSGAIVTDGRVEVIGEATWIVNGSARTAKDGVLSDLPLA